MCNWILHTVVCMPLWTSFCKHKCLKGSMPNLWLSFTLGDEMGKECFHFFLYQYLHTFIFTMTMDYFAIKKKHYFMIANTISQCRAQYLYVTYHQPQRDIWTVKPSDKKYNMARCLTQAYILWLKTGLKKKRYIVSI